MDAVTGRGTRASDREPIGQLTAEEGHGALHPQHEGKTLSNIMERRREALVARYESRQAKGLRRPEHVSQRVRLSLGLEVLAPHRSGFLTHPRHSTIAGQQPHRFHSTNSSDEPPGCGVIGLSEERQRDSGSPVVPGLLGDAVHVGSFRHGEGALGHHVDGSAVLAASGASASDERWATACGSQGSTTRDDGGAHGVVADPELHADLDQGEAVGI